MIRVVWGGISLVLIFSMNLSAKEIKLPPDPGPKNNETLLGVDSNKNNVRDDVEIYIYNNISKDPKVFKAYLNLAENFQNRLKNIHNQKKLDFLESQRSHDVYCIGHVDDSASGVGTERLSQLSRLLNNTKIRQEALEMIHVKTVSQIKRIPKDLSKSCR